jgi:flagellar basal-body rod protein FlgC
LSQTHTFAISAAGMDLERLRVEVAAANLANANTVAADGAAYLPMRVVARPVAAAAAAVASGFGTRVAHGLAMPAAVVEPTGAPVRRVIDPGHPLADAAGFVNYPGVDTTTEMMTLMTAIRSYEANVAALNAARTMALKALEIGGAQ